MFNIFFTDAARAQEGAGNATILAAPGGGSPARFARGNLTGRCLALRRDFFVGMPNAAVVTPALPKPRLLAARHHLCGPVALVLVAVCLTACRSVGPLAPADLAAPGWSLRQGQAVWRPHRRAPEIAGELLLATHREGRVFVQFSKTPFSLLTGQAGAGRWQIEFTPHRRSRSGPGSSPARFIWLHLARVLEGGKPPGRWSFTKLDAQRWRLENAASGESLEGFLVP